MERWVSCLVLDILRTPTREEERHHLVKGQIGVCNFVETHNILFFGFRQTSHEQRCVSATTHVNQFLCTVCKQRVLALSPALVDGRRVDGFAPNGQESTQRPRHVLCFQRGQSPIEMLVELHMDFGFSHFFGGQNETLQDFCERGTTDGQSGDSKKRKWSQKKLLTHVKQIFLERQVTNTSKNAKGQCRRWAKDSLCDHSTQHGSVKWGVQNRMFDSAEFLPCLWLSHVAIDRVCFWNLETGFDANADGLFQPFHFHTKTVSHKTRTTNRSNQNAPCRQEHPWSDRRDESSRGNNKAWRVSVRHSLERFLLLRGQASQKCVHFRHTTQDAKPCCHLTLFDERFLWSPANTARHGGCHRRLRPSADCFQNCLLCQCSHHFERETWRHSRDRHKQLLSSGSRDLQWHFLSRPRVQQAFWPFQNNPNRPPPRAGWLHSLPRKWRKMAGEKMFSVRCWFFCCQEDVAECPFVCVGLPWWWAMLVLGNWVPWKFPPNQSPWSPGWRTRTGPASQISTWHWMMPKTWMSSWKQKWELRNQESHFCCSAWPQSSRRGSKLDSVLWLWREKKKQKFWKWHVKLRLVLCWISPQTKPFFCDHSTTNELKKFFSTNQNVHDCETNSDNPVLMEWPAVCFPNPQSISKSKESHSKSSPERFFNSKILLLSAQTSFVNPVLSNDGSRRFKWPNLLNCSM